MLPEASSWAGSHLLVTSAFASTFALAFANKFQLGADKKRLFGVRFRLGRGKISSELKQSFRLASVETPSGCPFRGNVTTGGYVVEFSVTWCRRFGSTLRNSRRSTTTFGGVFCFPDATRLPPPLLLVTICPPLASCREPAGAERFVIVPPPGRSTGMSAAA